MLLTYWNKKESLISNLVQITLRFKFHFVLSRFTLNLVQDLLNCSNDKRDSVVTSTMNLPQKENKKKIRDYITAIVELFIESKLRRRTYNCIICNLLGKISYQDNLTSSFKESKDKIFFFTIETSLFAQK